jgi:hypothetical protein
LIRNLKITGALLVGFLLSVFVGATFLLGQRVSLTAKTELIIYDSVSREAQVRKPIGIIAAGETVALVDCVDLKSDFDFQIKNKLGVTGYVQGGDFYLTHGNVFGGAVKAPITYSCP